MNYDFSITLVAYLVSVLSSIENMLNLRRQTADIDKYASKEMNALFLLQ